MEKIEFLPVLLASDINVYSMARAFYEEYRVKSLVIAKKTSGIIDHSKILIFEEEKEMDEQEVFLRKLNEVYKRYEGSGLRLILIGCSDHYVRLIVENKAALADKFVLPYTDLATLNHIVLKETFYELCETYGLDYPDTRVFHKGDSLDFTLNFNFPVILKPSDSVAYWRAPFENQYKVYTMNSMEELVNMLKRIYGAGYQGNMIIQDVIPGADAFMRDLHVFVGKDKKVKLMNLGNVLLEEHTPKGLGSNAVTINDYNEELMLKIKDLLEGIGYSGWADCDIKFDSRDQKYKMFEINIRQGRSHYRVTGCGDNVAKYIVDDYIYNVPMELKLVKKDFIWHVIPKQLIYKYVEDPALLKKIRGLFANGQSAHSLFYKEDLAPKRLLYLVLRNINQFRKYKKYL